MLTKNFVPTCNVSLQVGIIPNTRTLSYSLLPNFFRPNIINNAVAVLTKKSGNTPRRHHHP